MTINENKALLETLYKEDLAEKIYLSDEENERLLTGSPDDIPADVFFEDIKEGEEIIRRVFKYSLVENCDALLKMKLLKKSRSLLAATAVSLMISLASFIMLLVVLIR